MRNKLLNWGALSDFRSDLMGFAILVVFIFHSGLHFSECPIINVMLAHGSVGVDTFFFLSAIGLSFSMSKNPRVTSFYRKRVLRIFPTFWLIITLVYSLVFGLNLFVDVPDDYIEIPLTFKDFFMVYSTLGYWFYGNMHYEWYVPTILSFYMFFPFFYYLMRRSKWIVIFAFLPLLFASHLLIPAQYALAYYRIPIFILGIYFYFFVKDRETRGAIFAVLVGILLFVIFNLSFHNYITLSNYLGYFLLLLALPGSLLGLTLICRIPMVHCIFAFLGEISLELYLIHIKFLRFFSTISNKIIAMPDFVRIFVAFLFCVLISYLVHRFVSYVLSRFKLL